MGNTTNPDQVTQLKLNLVKYVINVKQAENSAKLQARANEDQKLRLMALLEQKKNDQLLGASVEDIEAQIKALG